MNTIQIPLRIKRLTPTAILPTYGTDQAAGMDLHADIPHHITVQPGGRALIPTGIAMSLPAHLALFVCPRSGLSNKSGITVHNGPGVIDGDYRGGLGVILHNTTDQQFHVAPGDRIAQGVIVPVFQAVFEEVEELDETARGTGGFGSTGVSQAPSPPLSVLDQEVLLPSGKPMDRNSKIGLRALAQEAADRRRHEGPPRWLEAAPETGEEPA
ncbi:deoxyuridine 5'-triphosphate nucleotidohydrolase [Methylobacterium sp. PvP062]|uniref:Deoxyuridine 5'-triphosphate nucleotidohydrolase n=1 Tax=Methylobacterium radiotolerans TaxID=31998 RepID=A0ABV2NU10_9HYPH|nr:MULTISPECIES: dUTP diphosphatase [unclassified Methylobacterium]MBP2498380.1 dUTP pyrophosphatase [Methylobacterium sp. PvP105]MBP2505764.1 dUTP pyrophosphatase [Methylobacterium sp. PvP109]